MNSVSNKMKITRTLKASLAAKCLFAFGDASARALVGLDYSVMTGNTVQVVFTFDEPAVAPPSTSRHGSRSILATLKTGSNNVTCRSA